MQIPTDVEQLLERQDGLVSRAQALAAGLSESDLRRQVRRREWARVHPGVFVHHTGPLSWQQRAWAAVLHAEPAALFGPSVLRLADGPGRRHPGDDGRIHVAVDRSRPVRPPGDEVVVHRVLDLASKVQWNLGPPRMRVEEAVIDVASRAADELAVVAVLGDALGSRLTTAARLQQALDRRARIPRRRLISTLLADVGGGASSALEHRYLVAVERRHGLPTALRQVRASSRGPVCRDVVYQQLELVVELDGRLDHTSVRDRDLDLERDLDASLDGLTTVRLGWGQVAGRPCSTAGKLAVLMRRRGWIGSPSTCSLCDGGDSRSPGDRESPRSA